MTTHAGLRLGAVALVVLAVLLLGGSHLCGVAIDKNASDPGMRPIAAGVMGCTEFWLNRYQTLIAALIAGGIAFWASRLLFKQVETQRFDFIGRQLTELQSIHTSVWELWRSCQGELGPNFKIRVHGEQTGLAALGVYEVRMLAFWQAIQKAREAIVRLETFARRPIGPFETAALAEDFARSVAEYLQICQADAYPGLAPLGTLGPLFVSGPELRDRHPETYDRHAAISDALNNYIRTYKRESSQLKTELARAHSVAR